MAQDIFLQLQDVTGEAQDAVHGEEIDVLSFSWGATQSGTTHLGSGSGGGRSNVQDLSITKYIDKASNTLCNYCCSGKHIPSGKLTVRKAAGDDKLEYYVFEMTDILVTSYQIGGSGSEDRYTEHVSLNFGAFTTTYLPQAATGEQQGSVEFKYDIAANEVG